MESRERFHTPLETVRYSPAGHTDLGFFPPNCLNFSLVSCWECSKPCEGAWVSRCLGVPAAAAAVCSAEGVTELCVRTLAVTHLAVY